jgi:hypothetical protein
MAINIIQTQVSEMEGINMKWAWYEMGLLSDSVNECGSSIENINGM